MPEIDGAETSSARRPSAAVRHRRRMVVLAAVGVVGALVLVALFFVGTRLPGILNPGSNALPAAAPTDPASTTPSPTPSPTSTSGPQLAGQFVWSDLRGGECLDPFYTAWQQRFTVVDCAGAHAGQLVSTGPLSVDPAEAYPGSDYLADQMTLICQNPANFDFSVVAAYPDAVWQASYPLTDDQWMNGQRNFYCFVSRTGLQPITGDFAAASFATAGQS